MVGAVVGRRAPVEAGRTDAGLAVGAGVAGVGVRLRGRSSALEPAGEAMQGDGDGLASDLGEPEVGIAAREFDGVVVVACRTQACRSCPQIVPFVGQVLGLVAPVHDVLEQLEQLLGSLPRGTGFAAAQQVHQVVAARARSDEVRSG